jgi:hypothetical protein
MLFIFLTILKKNHCKSPEGKWNHHLGVNAECWSVHPSRGRAKKPHFSKPRLSFIQLTTITESERAHWRLFVISYTTHRALSRTHTHTHKQRQRCKVWPWIPNVCTAREKASAWQNFYIIHIHKTCKRGEYYFRHVPEKQKGLPRALLSLCVRTLLFCLQKRCTCGRADWRFEIL